MLPPVSSSGLTAVRFGGILLTKLAACLYPNGVTTVGTSHTRRYRTSLYQHLTRKGDVVSGNAIRKLVYSKMGAARSAQAAQGRTERARTDLRQGKHIHIVANHI